METQVQVLENRTGSGFEYRYRLWMDDDIISLYEEKMRRSRRSSSEDRRFLVEVQTNFILKPISGEEIIMDSERFASILWVSEDERELLLSICYRLFEYWLSMEEIEMVVQQAFCFSKRMEADPQHAPLLVIPIVLGIDVCTVQLEAELLDATMDRLIKSDCLIPFPVWGFSMVLSKTETRFFEFGLSGYLVGLPRERVERVEDVDKALVRMESCPICLRPPTYGAQLTPLSCNPNHIFHNHCIIRWLIVNKSCPLCRFKIDHSYSSNLVSSRPKN